MSRTIKFRSWDGYRMSKPFTLMDIQLSKASLNRFGEIVMQFTGLTDKNGKEIYESDSDNIGVVVFRNGAFWYDIIDIDESILLIEVSGKIEINCNLHEKDISL